ncbi:pentapeptide repeat-containing protein [Streptomyces sp. NBC_01643]|uniref:pentapeptide repeat-containing protein n=1 Tax=Streptomyces sp. NBC_01643 TaxID=2975906 RepID=UPI0038632F43|nr:pentapeptide repeat-containing protein [Streptomyces sp. NBC_01643]
MTHLSENEKSHHIGSLRPGSSLDYRGTRITGDSLNRVLEATKDADGYPNLGRVEFGHAVMPLSANFARVRFSGSANFNATVFSSGDFSSAIFVEDANFPAAIFSGNVDFSHAVFEKAPIIGPLGVDLVADFSGAQFGSTVLMKISARHVLFVQARWSSTATIQLRHASFDLAHSFIEYPISVSREHERFHFHHDGVERLDELDREIETWRGDEAVTLLSLVGVDAAHVTLFDIDLSECTFAGAIHLDQLRMEGECNFSKTPYKRHRQLRGLQPNKNAPGLRVPLYLPVFITKRSAIVEEHLWRNHGKSTVGWEEAEDIFRVSVPLVSPSRMAPVYRSLRKSFEDSKNEPGAADFYYGEMEMRRLDWGTSRVERWILALYWVLSGYGLRAARTFAWLLLFMGLTLACMMWWGVAKVDPKPETTGRQVAVGRQIDLITDTPDPVNPTGGWDERITGDRFEKSLRVLINSVVFRSSGQDLTTTGTYMEMVSRVTEPVLLGLAVLAVRNRVKR